MKTTYKLRFAVAAVMAVCCVLLSACGGDPGASTQNPTGQTQDPTGGSVLSFVAADKTNWDKEINVGDYAYTLAVELKDGGVLELNATCTGRAQAAVQQGGPGGGFGGMGGGEESEPTPEPPALTDAEKAAQNFSKSGSWTYETGYGYTVTIDGYTTKTSYEKASARQVFYAEITNNGASSGLVQFQGKDTAFRNEIAADYEDFEIRDAQYIFTGSGTTATGNASSTKLYLEKDGSANALAQQGSSPTYTRGTWSENADRSITLNIGGSAYTLDYCAGAGKEGYRAIYNSSTMYSNTAASYTDEDFDGAALKTLQCAEGDYILKLTDKGKAVLYQNGSRNDGGTYTENGDGLTVIIGGKTYASENGTITMTFTVSDGSSGTTDEMRTFNLDGTVPEGNAPGGEGGFPGGGMPGGEGGFPGGGMPGGEGGFPGGEGGMPGGEGGMPGSEGGFPEGEGGFPEGEGGMPGGEGGFPEGEGGMPGGEG